MEERVERGGGRAGQWESEGSESLEDQLKLFDIIGVLDVILWNDLGYQEFLDLMEMACRISTGWQGHAPVEDAITSLRDKEDVGWEDVVQVHQSLLGLIHPELINEMQDKSDAARTNFALDLLFGEPEHQMLLDPPTTSVVEGEGVYVHAWNPIPPEQFGTSMPTPEEVEELGRTMVEGFRAGFIRTLGSRNWLVDMDVDVEGEE